MRRFVSSLVVMAFLTGVAPAETKVSLSGDNTKVEFVGRKPDGKHDGGFKTITGTAAATGDVTTLKIAVEIDTNSLYSDDAKLTAHLKAPDFFAVKRYPKITFDSTKVEKSAEGYTVTGDLKMLGKSKSVSFPAKISLTEGALTLTASFKIDRTEWGMTYGKGKIDDHVDLTVSVNARK